MLGGGGCFLSPTLSLSLSVMTVATVARVLGKSYRILGGPFPNALPERMPGTPVRGEPGARHLR